MSREECAVPGCHSKPEYYIGFENPDGRVAFGYVCDIHDKDIGLRNLIKSSGLTKEVAAQLGFDHAPGA